MKNYPYYPTISASLKGTRSQFLSPSDSINQLSARVISDVDREIASRFDVDGAIEKAKQQRIDVGFPVNK